MKKLTSVSFFTFKLSELRPALRNTCKIHHLKGIHYFACQTLLLYCTAT